MRRIVIFISPILLIVILVLMVGGSSAADGLPDEVNFLGEGPGAFQTSLDGFVVKRFSPFRFDLEPGPTFETPWGFRVWEQSGAPGAPPAVWEEEVVIGQVTAGCTAKYIGIDDDLDNRRNAFYRRWFP